jgi:hypothetical protein
MKRLMHCNMSRKQKDRLVAVSPNPDQAFLDQSVVVFFFNASIVSSMFFRT